MSVSIRNTADQFLSADELQDLKRASDGVGVRVLAGIWGLIVLTFTIVALYPHPLVILGALFVLGGRQLALAVAMHEAAHKSLFHTRSLNEWCGQWLSAHPVFQDMLRYRKHHLSHHRYTGTAQDPDLKLASGFPISRASFSRKLLRDLSGITGAKVMLGTLLMLSGVMRYDVSGNVQMIDQSGLSTGERLHTAWRGLRGPLLMQVLLFTAVWVCGVPWLYLVWFGAWLTTYQLFLRIRSIAEHAMTPDPYDALNNARTTRARWWEKLFYAPLNVSYHLEHHMLVTAPQYQLPRMHRLLQARGAFDAQPASLADSYGDVLRMTVRP
ncbi:MAG: fatty acid desaturase family protein [Nevskiales bacterium]